MKLTSTFLALTLCALPGAAQQVTIPQGTQIEVRLTTALSSADATKGMPITGEAISDVKLNGSVVIYAGAPVRGTVTQAQSKRRMGRAGQLAIAVDDVRAADGTLILVTAHVKKVKGQGGYGAGSGVGVAATGLIFFPAGPLWLLKHGHDTEIPYGTTFTVEVSEREAQIDLAKAVPPVKPVIAPAARIDNQVPRSEMNSWNGGQPSELNTYRQPESLADAARRLRAEREAKASPTPTPQRM